MPDFNPTKRCCDCLQEKPCTEFYRRNDRVDQFSARCKPCHRTHCNQYAKTPSGKETKRRYRNKPTTKELRNRYFKRPDVKEVTRTRRRKYYRRSGGKNYKVYYRKYTDKSRARVALGKAVRTGKITRPATCSKCGATGKIEAHHYLGYAWENRYDVQWLCISCHAIAG